MTTTAKQQQEQVNVIKITGEISDNNAPPGI